MWQQLATQPERFSETIVLLAIGGGVMGAALYHAFFGALAVVFQVVGDFLARRNRIAHARKRAALFSRLARGAQAELDKLQAAQEQAQGAPAGGAVARACERGGDAGAGA
ncbi:hypothetical protein AA671_11505 [Delftia tsuruhatensis]|uniref:hypothetical protein n=1 Tax=Delftia TaxID=80865 RepID=UPI000641D2DC|nr:hypothetical protein [Delftia tsuruhatensis]KLO60138.1 hypothetical protein AA671_11505 [Delftia tsuruhatensis]